MNNALELVRAYEVESVWSDTIVSEWIHNAAAELRRLAEENNALDKAGYQVVEELAQVKAAYDYLQEERNAIEAEAKAKVASYQTVLAAVECERDELLAALKGLTEDIQGLIGESYGVFGLHLNGDVAPWGELEAGGRFERLTHLPDAYAAIASVEGN